MILKDNFYTIEKQEFADNKAEFRIKLNADSFIYQAHFPGNPITPGVCLIQIATELFGFLKDGKFNIKVLKNVKFTAPINPQEFSEVDFLLDFSEKEDLWQVKVVIKENETVFAKISMILSTNYTN